MYVQKKMSSFQGPGWYAGNIQQTVDGLQFIMYFVGSNKGEYPKDEAKDLGLSNIEWIENDPNPKL